MKTLIENHWPKMVALILLLAMILVYVNRDSIFENKITQSKMEIWKGVRDQDMDRVKRGIDTLKKVTTKSK